MYLFKIPDIFHASLFPPLLRTPIHPSALPFLFPGVCVRVSAGRVCASAWICETHMRVPVASSPWSESRRVEIKILSRISKAISCSSQKRPKIARASGVLMPEPACGDTYSHIYTPTEAFFVCRFNQMLLFGLN
jgi:hypothetical protein